MATHDNIPTRPAHPLAIRETGDGPQTMSSQEIAGLTGKTLSNVNRDIRKMAKKVHGDHSDLNDPCAPAIPGIIVERDRRGYASVIHLDRDHTMTMITGYDTALRHKIIKRWAELERANVAAEVPAFRIPTTLREALLLAAEQEAEIERQRAIADDATARAIETEQTKAEIGSRREATAMATAGAEKRRADKLKLQLDIATSWATVRRMEFANPGRKFPFAPLKAASNALGLEVKKIFDDRWGSVNTYHALAWKQAYDVEVPGWDGTEGANHAA
ncbi:hypothetical protein ACQKQD_17945 [Methylobacterium sp. NPDC080182]|uniref:hypothetical protein n=1 Tax=Methylobacterium sp. NPDC080182 TaxID=3390590 RepID=UPI003D08DD97